MTFPATKVVQLDGQGRGLWQFQIIDPRTGKIEEVSDLYEREEYARDAGVYLLDDLLRFAINRRRAAQRLRMQTGV